MNIVFQLHSFTSVISLYKKTTHVLMHSINTIAYYFMLLMQLLSAFILLPYTAMTNSQAFIISSFKMQTTKQPPL